MFIQRFINRRPYFTPVSAEVMDEAGLGTALIVGFMSAKQDAMWITIILTRFAGVWSECML